MDIKDFRVSSIVKLKSGGPEMTVNHIQNGTGQIECSWFEETKHTFKEFDYKTLDLIKY